MRLEYAREGTEWVLDLERFANEAGVHIDADSYSFVARRLMVIIGPDRRAAPAQEGAGDLPSAVAAGVSVLQERCHTWHRSRESIDQTRKTEPSSRELGSLLVSVFFVVGTPWPARAYGRGSRLAHGNRAGHSIPPITAGSGGSEPDPAGWWPPPGGVWRQPLRRSMPTRKRCRRFAQARHTRERGKISAGCPVACSPMSKLEDGAALDSPVRPSDRTPDMARPRGVAFPGVSSVNRLITSQLVAF